MNPGLQYQRSLVLQAGLDRTHATSSSRRLPSRRGQPIHRLLRPSSTTKTCYTRGCNASSLGPAVPAVFANVSAAGDFTDAARRPVLIRISITYHKRRIKHEIEATQRPPAQLATCSGHAPRSASHACTARANSNVRCKRCICEHHRQRERLSAIRPTCWKQPPQQTSATDAVVRLRHAVNSHGIQAPPRNSSAACAPNETLSHRRDDPATCT